MLVVTPLEPGQAASRLRAAADRGR